MAQVLSQEEVLDFLCRAGGKVSNATLLRHFGSFLRDPALSPKQRQRHRDCFKRYVNSVAVVKEEASSRGETKFVVLRARYRDLLGEDDLLSARGYSDPKEDWSRENTKQSRSSPQETISLWGSASCEGRTIEPSITFIAACRSDVTGSQAHTYLGGPARADSVPNNRNPNQARSHDAEESSLVSGNRPGIRLPPPVLPASPTKGYTTTSSHYILSTRGTFLPCPPRSSATYLSPSSATGITSPLFHPATTKGRGTTSPCPSNARFSPCPVTMDGDPLPESSSCTCVPFFLALGADTVPPPGSISPAFPPLNLYMAAKNEEWPPANQPPLVSSPSVLPGDGLESGWWGQLPVFKSIRSQLSLQDLEEFVDQATNESLDSDQSSRSDSADKNQTRVGVGSGNEGMLPKSPTETCDAQWCDIPYNKQSNHLVKKNCGRLAGCETAANHCRQSVTNCMVLEETTLISDSQPPSTNQSQRVMKTAYLQNRPSSSCDELMDSECPPCTKKAAKGSARDVDLTITHRPIGTNPFSAIARDFDLPATFGPVAAATAHLNLPERSVPTGAKHLTLGSDFAAPKQIHSEGLSNEVLCPECKTSSLVPLDPKEHDWAVKLASGSWMQVYGLFQEDPHLALQKDFISGYTALHWIAKHGNCQMFENLLSGAEKAGIKLDVDVKSSSGYTALHLAAIHGHVKLLKLLVQKIKVKVSIRDHSGKKAWQYLSCTTTGEVWQLLGAPTGKTIFPVCALPTNPTVAKNPRSPSALTHLSRKTSLVAFLKPQHTRWKSHVRGKMPDLKEVYSD